jgi:ACS family hexuronate transporter-like MFS transporter
MMRVLQQDNTPNLQSLDRPARSRVRWTICALLFGVTTINLLNRQVFGILAADLQRIFNWNEVDYGYIVGAFQLSYALGLALAGWFIDRVGTRIGYAMMIGIWSLVTIAHMFVRTTLGFLSIRFLLGLSEAGNFPAAIKSSSEWFPARERSLVAGIINAGTNLGGIAAALLVPWLTVRYGWQSAFAATGVLGLLWCVWWSIAYRDPENHPRLSKSEYALIQDGRSISTETKSQQKVSWIRLLRFKQTWAFALVKMTVDPVWFFFLSWLPKFLYQTFHLPIIGLSLPLVVVYIASDIGSVVGGYLPVVFLRRGHTMAAARRRAMLPCAIAVIPMIYGSHYNSLWLVVAGAGLALAGAQGWSSNAFAMVPDLFPSNSVGSVVGFGSMVGSVSAAIFAVIAGWVLQATGSYTPLFIYCACSYLIAFGIIQLLVPRLERADISEISESAL